MMGLGLLGKGETGDAARVFEEILMRDPSNLDAVIHVRMAREGSTSLALLESQSEKRLVAGD